MIFVETNVKTIETFDKEKSNMGDPMARLLELDARHLELLDRLTELDREVEQVLFEWTQTKERVLEMASEDDSSGPSRRSEVA